MAILVLADTHLNDARADSLADLLGDRLDRADAIIHAGDVTGRAVLDVLARFAPVSAVLGNNDIGLDLPERLLLDVGGVLIGAVHDSGLASGRAARLSAMFPTAEVVVFGHSHLPRNEHVDIDGRTQVQFNPGSPTQRRRAPTRTVGWIEVGADGIACRHEHL